VAVSSAGVVTVLNGHYHWRKCGSVGDGRWGERVPFDLRADDVAAVVWSPAAAVVLGRGVVVQRRRDKGGRVRQLLVDVSGNAAIASVNGSGWATPIGVAFATASVTASHRVDDGNGVVARAGCGWP
jgi:hypothetical protein